MNIRMIAAIFAGTLLCGCSTWNGAMSTIGLGQSDEDAQPAAAPVTPGTTKDVSMAFPGVGC